MLTLQADITGLPIECWLCAILLMVACALALRQHHQLWVAPFVAVIGTAAAWYMIEPIYFSEYVSDFSYNTISDAYKCLTIFLVTLIVITPLAVRALQPEGQPQIEDIHSLTPDQLVPRVVILWLCLLSLGVYRMNGDILGALLPIEGRAGNSMWMRDAAGDAGSTGFLVSTANYVYVLVLSLFGLLLPL